MIEAEQSLISSMVTNNDCLIDVFEIINHSDFISDKHRQIVKAIEECHSNGVVDVFDVSEKSGEFEYITDLVTGTHRFSPVVAANIVKKESFRRRALQNLDAATKSVVESETMDGCLNAVSSVLDGLEVDDGKHEEFDDLLKRAINNLDDRMQGKAPKGLMTGFDSIDQRLNGIKKQDFRILAGRPSMGKTTLVLNEACHIAMNGGNVLFFSVEMGKEQLMDKMLASVSGISSRAIETGQFEENDHHLIQIGVSKIKGANINIIDKGGIDIGHLSNIAKKFNRTKKLDAIYIDYLQLVTCKSVSRFEEISEISRRLKALTKEIDVPITALSQLSRKVEERQDKRPMNSDLRESGQIEQDADIIQFVYRDEYYNKEKSKFPNVAEVITSKFRMGQVGTDYLGCELNRSRFTNLDYIPQPIEQEEYRPYKPYGK